MRYIWLLGLGIVVGAVALWYFVPSRRRRERFADRENLPMDGTYAQFFVTQKLPKELVIELWKEIAIPLRVPPGKLRPQDRFDKELAPIEGWELDDDTVEIHWAAQKRLQKLGADADISTIQTLRDYIEFFCKLEMAKE